MARFFAFPSGRHAKWIVFGAWLAIVFATIAGNLPAKFDDAQRNDSSSFLPGNAESTKTLDITKQLQGGDILNTVIVYRRAGGLTAGDRARIAADRAALNRKPLPRTTRFAPPVPSRDGTSALLVNEITSNGKGDTIVDPVDAYRKQLEDQPPGLVAKVTGPAGYSADAIKVFANINGTLLLAASALVFFLLILIYRSPFLIWLPLIAVGFAEITSRRIGYGLTEAGITVNGQSSSILSVLVLGAGTDYALLLVARYREELRRHADKHEALALALRAAGPAIVASALTVSAGLLCLSVAKVNGTA